MFRFAVERVKIEEFTHSKEYQVIKDLESFQKVECEVGTFRMGNGFIRQKGKQYIGLYGQATPVFAGSEDEIYYAPVSYFDGRWTHSKPNSRGLHTYVTARSGNGVLFAALESFANVSGIEAGE